jgi:hypothetical protein
VRVDVDEQERTQGADLAAVLWPVVMERVARCEIVVRELGDVLREGRGSDAGVQDVLVAARAESAALGWLLGCIAEGLGSELLQQRRAGLGLAWVLDLLSTAAAQRGRELRLESPLPQPDRNWSGAELWACADVLWWASERTRAPVLCSFEVSGDAWSLRCEGMLDPAVAQRARSWSRAEPRVEPTSWSWTIGCGAASEVGA